MSTPTAATKLTFVIDDDQFYRALHETEDDIAHLVGIVALDVKRELEQEGGKYAKSLGDNWTIEGVGTAREIAAPVWWAHFVAGGTQAHGPVRAPQMAFEVDGEFVFAGQVKGQRATHFDEAALRNSRSHLPEILRRTVG